MQIIRKKISELIPAPYNPRKNIQPGDSEYEKLKRSLEEFGYVEPVIWNARIGYVVGVHQRLKVLIELGETETECVIVDLPDEQEKALNIALNKISGDWDMGKLEFLMDELTKAFSCMFLYMADHASIYVFHADTLGFDFRKAFQDSGLYLSQVCIWVKNHFSLGRTLYQYQHEPVLFGWKNNHKWYSDRKQSTVWEFDRPQKSKEHPTMKPIPLLAYPIRNSSKSGEIVLDPFGSSGSTLIACEQTGRRCFTIELDEKYCDVIVSRYIEHVGSSTGVSLERDGKTYSYDEVKSP